MKTDWEEQAVSLSFDAYDDYVEERLGYEPLIARLVDRVGLASAILDYGCGSGKVSRRLTGAGFECVHGVDISSTMIERAAANREPENARCQYHHVQSGKLPLNLPFFDAAICCFVFINIHSESELLNVAGEIFRSLKPGGRLFILDTNPNSIGVKFSTFQNGEKGVSYNSGDARPVYLTIPGQTAPFKIVDTHWPKSMYVNTLSASGFKNIIIEELTSAHLSLKEKVGLSAAEESFPPFIMISADK